MRHPEGQETGPGDDTDGVMVRSIVVGTVVMMVVGAVVTNVVGTRTVVGCRVVNVTVEKTVDTVVTAGRVVVTVSVLAGRVTICVVPGAVTVSVLAGRVTN